LEPTLLDIIFEHCQSRREEVGIDLHLDCRVTSECTPEGFCVR